MIYNLKSTFPFPLRSAGRFFKNFNLTRIVDRSKKFIFNSNSLATKMSPIKIGTHNGMFHCDEVLACYMLKTLPKYKDAEIVRSRDLSVLDTCDIVVDVGGKYDPATHRYDHHMREFKETFTTVMNKPGYESDIKLSSAGLVYCHFGREIISNLVPELSEEEVEIVFKKVYENFMKAIDGIDNGVQMYDGEPAFYISTDLSSRIRRLNPSWNTPDMNENEQFKKAMVVAGDDFTSFLNSSARIWLPARSLVKDAVESRFKVDESGEIMELINSIPWKEHLENLEKELSIDPLIKFVIYKDESNNNYRVQGVPEEYGSFKCRLFLPEEWGGLRDEELSAKAGIEGCIFVHTNRFIGGNKTREGVLKMARFALKVGKI